MRKLENLLYFVGTLAPIGGWFIGAVDALKTEKLKEGEQSISKDSYYFPAAFGEMLKTAGIVGFSKDPFLSVAMYITGVAAENSYKLSLYLSSYW